MASPVPQVVARTSPEARVGVTVLFAMNGMVLGAFGGALPALRDRLDTDARGLAVILVATGIAAVASMQVGGRLADHVGARPVALLSMPVMVAGVVGVAMAPTLAWAVAGGVLIGLGNGSMDVAMNALGVQVEAVRSRPVMSGFHAFFSLGQFTGAGIVLLAGVLVDGDVAQPSLLAAALVGLIVVVAARRTVPLAEPVPHRVEGIRTPIPPAAWLLAAMAVCFGLTEGTAVDWSAVHVRDVTEVDSATAALGLAAVSGFMVLIRLFGDRIVHRLGRRRVVTTGALVAGGGFTVVTLTDPLGVVLAGWSLVGLGVGLVAPQIYGLAGHLGGGRVLAVVVGFGYGAFLVGPAIIGALAHALGVQHAMALPLVLCFVLAALATRMPQVRTHADS